MIFHIPDYILYEDEILLVVDKPHGLMVEPDRNNYPNLLQEVKKYLKASQPSKGEIYTQHIHRLDRVVSGVILFAKERSVLKNLSEQFAERRVRKFYRALTTASPLNRAGTLEHWHRKEKKKAVLYAEQVQYAEMALLSYNVSEINKTCFLWDIELHTGKFHQIRAQLASLDCPIDGDALYGSPIPYKADAIALQAFRLDFTHPVNNQVLSIISKNQLSRS